MAGMATFDLHLILYGLLVLITAFGGYYLGNMYDHPFTGLGVGAIGGVIVAGLIYKYTGVGTLKFPHVVQDN
jgi:hypothetical protein